MPFDDGPSAMLFIFSHKERYAMLALALIGALEVLRRVVYIFIART